MKPSRLPKCNRPSALLSMYRRFKDDSGGPIVELALTLPLLFLILLGAAEFARVEYASIEVSNAALAGVQYGASGVISSADTTGISNAAANDASGVTLGTTTATLSYICSNGNASNGGASSCPGSNIETILTVNTTATFDPLIHLPGLPTTYTLYGQAVQKVLQ